MNRCNLSSDIQVKELQQLASGMSFDILSVQQHRHTSLDMDKPPSPGARDIGFLLSPRAMMALLFFSFPSHHIRKTVLHIIDRRFHVFCVYAPTAVGRHRAECHTFYDGFSSLVNDAPLHDHILICDDLNIPLTANVCRVKMYVMSRTANRKPYRCSSTFTI